MRSQQIIHLNGSHEFTTNFVVSENLSATGIRFTTSTEIQNGEYFLIYLNDRLMHEFRSLYRDKKDWLCSGDYYLAKAVWKKNDSPDFTEIGAAFVKKNTSTFSELQAFSSFLNANILQNLPMSMPLQNTAKPDSESH